MGFEEFTEKLAAQNLDEYCNAIGISSEDATNLFHLIDEDASGNVTISEFVEGCLRLRGPAKSTDLSTLAYNLRVQVTDIREEIIRLESYVCADMSRLSDLMARALHGNHSKLLGSSATPLLQNPLNADMEEVLV